MEYPRVTEILKAYTNFENVRKEILEKAASRGSTVHALCAGIARGEWIPDGMIDEEFRGYVSSFKKWSESQVSKFIIIEKRYMHDKDGFTGQLDFVVLGNDNELYLVDLKTSAKPNKTYPVQMAAYNHLLNHHQVKVKGAMLVYLDKTGEFPEVHLLEDMSEELRVFLSALECWYYFNKGKKNGRKQPIKADDCA